MMHSAPIDGFTVPLHRALTQAILLAGAPRGPAIALGTIAAAVGLGLQQFVAGLILWATGHMLLTRLAKLDPDFLSVTIRHLRYKGYLTC
jgi:type IV secretion system protein TrbD